MRSRIALWIGICLAVFAGCAAKQGPTLKEEPDTLIEVANSQRQWTGVAVSKEARIFVNFPRWSQPFSFSVAEVTRFDELEAFPSEEINQWDPFLPPGDHLICVQSVYVDDQNYLWILDSANPRFAGAVPNGPKLLKVDIDTRQVVQKILFDEMVAPIDSYLNDVRVDTQKKVAYLTDSGMGALVVVDLKTGQSRRLLSHHRSTKSENIALIIDGKEWRHPDGNLPQVHADGLALDPTGKYLYYQALTARSLYRIETRWLTSPTVSQFDKDFER
jgi:hypothetical protein